jgi:hypothetical protein
LRDEMAAASRQDGGVTLRRQEVVGGEVRWQRLEGKMEGSRGWRSRLGWNLLLISLFFP